MNGGDQGSGQIRKLLGKIDSNSSLNSGRYNLRTVYYIILDLLHSHTHYFYASG